MNYVQIMGGLGNQLFQYVFSKYAEKLTGHPSELLTQFYELDLESIEGVSAREYVLEKFNTKCIYADKNISYENTVTDGNIVLDKSVDNTLFNGYWQNIRYIMPPNDSAISDLTLKPEYISDDIRNIAAEIASCESVALHVRRADYLNDYNKNLFCALSLDYYKCAVNHLSDKIDTEPVLYVFSDDHDFVCSNMSDFEGFRTVIMEPHKDYEDLYLMSVAKHHIIANSTFSLWGALLSKHSDGVTIAPKRWFKDRPTPDLYPDNWICMDNTVNTPLISVIIPAYNVEKYIDKCLASIEAQTYGIKNLEIILIDDSSTDNTIEHLEAFEKKHPENVILIKLSDNSGQGIARNVGLDYATGEYITFVDSDDLIDDTMIQKLFWAITDYGCDVAECRFAQFSNDLEIPAQEKIDRAVYLNLSDVNDLRQLVTLNCAKTAVWGRLYRNDFIRNNRLRFVEHLIYEDVQFSGVSMFMMSTYCQINEQLYYYRYNEEGTTYSKYLPEKAHQEVTVINSFLNELLERDMLNNIIRINRRNLVVFCVSKSFIDPLYLLIRSNLGLSEIIEEIHYFKTQLLDVFPDAATNFYLSDIYDIYKLGIYLLKKDQWASETSFNGVDGRKTIFISKDHLFDKEIHQNVLRNSINDLDSRKSVYLKMDDYENEHLLLLHTIDHDDIITIISGHFTSAEDQAATQQYIRDILGEYTHNRIILFINDLFFDESDECLKMLTDMTEALNRHTDVSIFTYDHMQMSLGQAIMPDIHIECIEGITGKS